MGFMFTSIVIECWLMTKRLHFSSMSDNPLMKTAINVMIIMSNVLFMFTSLSHFDCLSIKMIEKSIINIETIQTLIYDKRSGNRSANCLRNKDSEQNFFADKSKQKTQFGAKINWFHRSDTRITWLCQSFGPQIDVN